MYKYALKRLLLLIPLLLAISVVVFLMVRLVPGDPVTLMLGEGANREAVEAERARLGLDQPVYIQYFRYMGGVLRGDLGTSIKSGKPVADEIAAAFAITFRLAVFSTLFAGVFGILLGIAAALHHNRFWDNAIMVLSLASISTPSFFLALIFLLLFSLQLKIFPSYGTGTPLHYVLPILTLGMRELGNIARTTRSSMLDVLHQDYIRTARAKGVPERTVTFLHAVRNALVPVVTSLGLRFGSMLAGSALVESVFTIRGIGRIMVDGVAYRDYPRIQGCVLTVAVTFVVVNTLVDVLYAVIDPRIKLS